MKRNEVFIFDCNKERIIVKDTLSDFALCVRFWEKKLLEECTKQLCNIKVEYEESGKKQSQNLFSYIPEGEDTFIELFHALNLANIELSYHKRLIENKAMKYQFIMKILEAHKPFIEEYP